MAPVRLVQFVSSTQPTMSPRFVKRLFAGVFCPFFFAWVLVVSIGAQLEPGKASEFSRVKVNDWN